MQHPPHSAQRVAGQGRPPPPLPSHGQAMRHGFSMAGPAMAGVGMAGMAGMAGAGMAGAVYIPPAHAADHHPAARVVPPPLGMHFAQPVAPHAVFPALGTRTRYTALAFSTRGFLFS